jgi:hypothetical protein
VIRVTIRACGFDECVRTEDYLSRLSPEWKALTVAQRTVVQLTDDLDGKAIPEGKGETVRFGVDGQDYEIDLSEKNAQALRDVVGKYVVAGRRVGGGSRGGSRSRGSSARNRDYDPKAVRAWAEAQGLEVSARGRVPADLVARFQEANA